MKIAGCLFSAALFCVFSTTPAQAHKTSPPKRDDSILLTYQEFKRLDPNRRREYLIDLQAFAQALAEDGPADSTTLFDPLLQSTKWSWLMSWLNTAHAAEPSCSDVHFYAYYNAPNQTMHYCTAYGSGPTTCSENVDDSFSVSAAKCPDQYNAFKANPMTKAGLFSGSSPMEGKEKQKLLDGLKGVDEKVKPPSSEKSVNTATPKAEKGLSCIYAGFALEKKESGTCDPERKFGDLECPIKSGGTTKADKKSSRETVLCNPVLFDYTGDGANKKPLCVARGKFATKNCAEKSKANHNEAIKNALKMTNEASRANFENVRRALSELCPGGHKTAETTKGMSAESQKDIENTCVHYKEAFNRYYSTMTGDPEGSPGIQ